MRPTPLFILLLIPFLLSACGGETEENADTISNNRAPSISGTPSSTITSGNLYSFTPAATDLDGDALSFSIQNQPSWSTFDSSTGTLTGEPGAGDVGTYTNISITVSDGIDVATIPPFTITVVDLTSVQSVNSRISSGMDDVEEASDGSMYVDSSDLELIHDDSDQMVGLRFTVDVPQGAEIIQANLQFTVDEVSTGDTNLLIWAEATDDATPFNTTTGDVSGRTSSSAVASWIPNPWQTIGESQTAETSTDLSQLIQEVVDRPGWQSGNHLVLVISGTGVRTAVSYEGGVDTAPLLRVQYSDSSTNHAPSIQGLPDTGATVGIGYSFTPVTNDSDGDTLTFSVSAAPSWASFDSSTGTLAGTPQTGDVGTYNNIAISVSDGENTVSLSPFSITVSETNHAPTITGTPQTSVTELSAYSFVPAANDADGDNLTFSVANLPGWASFDASDGSLTGTPGYADAGVYGNIVITVSDGAVSSSLSPFSISVVNNNRAPSISGTAVTSVNEGETYSFTPVASDADGDNLSFSVTNLPPWATFDVSNGSVSGTPDFDSSGDYADIAISVTDGSATSSLAPFSISVNDTNRAPTISGQPATNVLAGEFYSFAPLGEDADGDNLSYTVLNLPAWGNFNSTTGELSGTPSIGDLGSFINITISVSDGTDSAALNSFSITVTETTPSTSGNIFVDQMIGPNYCTDYDAVARSCGSGDKEAYKTLAGAANVAVAGDTIEIRSGSFGEQLSPQNSGTASNPVTYRAYNNESVVITGSSLTPAIVISDKSYLVIEGLEISNVKRWLYALNSHHNTIRNNIFSGANDSGGSSKTGLFFQEATHNKIVNNTIDDSTQDNISLIKSDFNLIEDNSITNAAHVLWTLKCSNKNILRNNYLYNPAQKIGEVYDCDDVGFDHEFFIHDSTKHNVIENNIFAKTTTYYSPSGGDGIQYAGQNGIIRFNTFYDNNVGIGMQSYSPEALYNKHNRIYHNTFHKNHCGGVATWNASSPDYTDNLFVNNAFSENVECGGTSPFQVVYRSSLEGVFFDNNNMTSGTIPDDVIGAWQGSGNTLAWFEANYPGFFSNNIEVGPGYVDPDNHDFSLTSSSQLIDSGKFLTTTTNSGSGRSIQVMDAGYFHDGFGIGGVTGDRIQLEGTSAALTVVSIDYDTNTITVDKDVSWNSNQGITLQYSGTRPDIGAYEY
ncbi:MAG: putative Ig domain-containing protein [Candidatus Thiodiazotropha sp.]